MRASDDAEVFLTDLASRMAGRIQLSTDEHKMYEATVGPSFRHQVDWAQIHETYASPTDLGKYSPPVGTGAKKIPLKGDPDPDRISASYVERQDLTMRMGMTGPRSRVRGLDQVDRFQGVGPLSQDPRDGGRGGRSRLVPGRDRGATGLTRQRPQ